ncbi:phage tail spike protein [Agrilactobacillus fermenti]|uniref:phage tail spike protein n=1 Tax=Agrilactobacillus fermenti TaxID=2586909 RepID=UPI001E46F4D2|nr:phage tail spike protein [Agrilactobacillus fermenti]MCD2256405.1 phage tail protein [Agrilactobacillus fermenti]
MRILLMNQKQQVFDIVTSLIEGWETLEINTAKQLDLTMALTKKNLANLQRAVYVGVPVRVGTGRDFHIYAIQSFKASDSEITLTGIEEAYDDLDAYGYLPEYRMKDWQFKDVADRVFKGTRWQFGNIPDIPKSTVYVYYISRLEGLKKLVNAFGVETDFVYTIQNNVITKRTVNFYQRLGKDTYKRFVYGSNALSIAREESRLNIYTAAVGMGKGEEKTDEAGNSTGGYGRKIRFDTVSWSKANGDPVDKPLGQEWVEYPDSTAKWGYSDGKPRTAIWTFDDIEDRTELLRATYDKLIENARPLVQFVSDITRIGDLSLGDSVIIVRHDIGIVYKARVFKIHRNLLDYTQTTVEIGDYLVKSQAEREDETQDQIDNTNDRIDETNNYVDDTKEEIEKNTDQKLDENSKNDQQYALDSANGRSKNYYGDTEPTGAIEGDLWFKGALGTGAVTMYKFIDGKWVEMFPEGRDEELKAAMKKADEETEKMIKAAGFDNAQQLYYAVNNNKNNIVDIRANVNGLQSTVTNNQNNTNSRFTQLSNLFDMKISNTENSLSSQITQKVNSIKLEVRGSGSNSYLYLNGSQVELGGSNIHINGNTYIENGAINNAAIANLDAGKIVSGQLNSIDITGQSRIDLRPWSGGQGTQISADYGISTSGTLEVYGWTRIHNTVDIYGTTSVVGSFYCDRLFINGTEFRP